jgi:Uncharacterized conserved protein
MRRDHALAPIEQGYVAIGWHEMGDLSLIKPTRDAFKAAYERAYPDAGPGKVRPGITGNYGDTCNNP